MNEFIVRENGTIVVLRKVTLSGEGSNFIFSILVDEFDTYWREQGEYLDALIKRLEAWK